MTGVATPAGFADHRQAGFGLRWLTLAEVLALHEKQLARFGGPSGVRDHGMLESALGRPRNKWDYERAELPTLAAAYAYGIARNHPFVDGNKRAAFVAMMLLLRLNGARFAPSQAEATQIMLGLAASDVSEESFARWIRDRLSDA
ncbi:MAG: type II toxin-antitoxin system death-on-curing family toxin [Ancalomicrobiaceae bacterium]|nr:type II toxin-antitoxin system death-on-curing family toxin [Ancalomicrobiaceae bacterium]